MKDAQVQSLVDRNEVIDALYRFGAGVDDNNSELIASALTQNAVLDFTHNKPLWGLDLPLLEGRDSIIAGLQGTVGPLDTTHQVTNPRVTIDGDKAKLSALLEAQHLPPGDHSRHCLMKNRYDVDLVRDGDQWRMHHILVRGVWFTGDPKVLIGQ